VVLENSMLFNQKSCPASGERKTFVFQWVAKEKKQLWQSRRCFPGCVLEVVLIE